MPHLATKYALVSSLCLALWATACDDPARWTERPGVWRVEPHYPGCGEGGRCAPGTGCASGLGDCFPKSDAELRCPDRHRWWPPDLCLPWYLPCAKDSACAAKTTCQDGYCGMPCSAAYDFCPPGFACHLESKACERRLTCGANGACPRGMACRPRVGRCFRRCGGEDGGTCPVGQRCPPRGGLCLPEIIPCNQQGACPGGQGCHRPTQRCVQRCGEGLAGCPRGWRCGEEGLCLALGRSCAQDHDCPPGGVCRVAAAEEARRCHLACPEDGACPAGERCIGVPGICAIVSINVKKQ